MDEEQTDQTHVKEKLYYCQDKVEMSPFLQSRDVPFLGTYVVIETVICFNQLMQLVHIEPSLRWLCHLSGIHISARDGLCQAYSVS